MQTAAGDGTRRDATRRWRRRTVVALVGAVLAAGCTSVTAGPIRRITTERAVGQAFAALGRQRGLRVTVSLGVTAAQVRDIEAREHARGVPAAVASSVARTSIVLDYSDGDRTLAHSEGASALAGARDATSELALDVDGGTPVQLRLVGTTVYGRAALPTLLGDFGVPAAITRREVAGIESANKVLPGADAFAEGRWVSADLASLSPLEKTPASGPTRALTLHVIRTLEASVRAGFTHDATFANGGDHGGRTEYTVEIASRAFVDRLLAAGRQAPSSDREIAPLLGMFPGTVTAIPAAQRTTIQVWVEHNRVEELDLDLNQFAHSLSFAVPLRVVLGAGAPVAAPAGATRIDLARLFASFDTAGFTTTAPSVG